MKNAVQALSVRLLLPALLSACAGSNVPPPAAITSSFMPVRSPGEIPPPSSVAEASRSETASPADSLTTAEPLALTLDKTVEIALDADPQIRSALETVQQSAADFLTASLPPNPVATVSGTLMPLTRGFTPTRQGGPPQFDAGVQFPIDWFLFGKRAAAMAAAKSGVDVANADFADLIRRRVAAAVATFYDVLEAQATVELSREDLADLLALERIIANRVEIGGIGTFEVDRIRLSIFSSRRELRTREKALASAFSRLRIALGMSDSRPIQMVGSLDVTKPVSPITLDQAWRIAYDNRPDITSLRLQVERAEASLTSEEKKAYPQITPGAGYTRQFQQQAIGYPDASSFGVSVNLSLPLFDRNQGNISKARSLKTQSGFDLKAGTVNLRAEVEQAVLAYQSAYQTLLTDDQGQIEAARHVRDKIRAAYELGGKTLIEVMDAQKTYRETYRLQISGRSDYWHFFHGLNAALGQQVLK